MSSLQTILVCDNYEISSSPNYHFRIFSGTQEDLVVVTITVPASDRKITYITKFSLTAVRSQKSNVLQVIYKAFQFSEVFLIFQEQQRQAAYT
ncbi:hypothetical protein A4S05_18530 [Nostoc sp. KVJ20]|uniref:hypothetical protein n=1 Tax=unclassified Nostoc TaxID=2593658 RepID=UPI00083D3F5C|nr:hypothetical protein [Nostoc sp. KVJ20]ODG96405.1 hypothetical protein A4S05_18530 [Nostoc sp. KVJ20]